MYTAAGPDPNPMGGCQLPNPNECNLGYLPLPLYIDVDERGHCLKIGVTAYVFSMGHYVWTENEYQIRRG